MSVIPRLSWNPIGSFSDGAQHLKPWIDENFFLPTLVKDQMKNLLTAALLIVAIFCFSNQALAKIYTWVDQDGVTHISDVPPTSDQNTETLETPDYPALILQSIKL